MTNVDIYISYANAVREDNWDAARQVAAAHPTLFWYGMTDAEEQWPMPVGALTDMVRDNPQVQYEVGEYAYCSYYYGTMVRLPDGEWVSVGSDGTWTETQAYIVCWGSNETYIEHLIAK